MELFEREPKENVQKPFLTLDPGFGDPGKTFSRNFVEVKDKI